MGLYTFTGMCRLVMAGIYPFLNNPRPFSFLRPVNAFNDSTLTFQKILTIT